MNGKIKVMACTPRVFLGSPYKNIQKITDCIENAKAKNVRMILFPDCALTGATLGDLASFPDMVEREEDALNMLISASCDFNGGIVIGQKDKVLYIKAGNIQKVFENEPAVIDGIQYIPASNPAEALGFHKTKEQISELSKICPIVYASAGYGESTTDTVPDGVMVIAEKGHILAENSGVYGDNFGRIREAAAIIADVEPGYMPVGTPKLTSYEPDFSVKAPFLPKDVKLHSEFARDIFHIQVASLVRRMEHIGAKCAVVAVSGGLDSTLAVLVAKQAVKVLGLPEEAFMAITLPCFGTTGRTLKNARGLMAAATPNNRTIIIGDAVNQHFKDIEHDPKDYSVVFENAQARERTQIALDLANKHGGVMVGTGDMSELCLGFTTFAGDHMSMYGVNGGLPKTIVRFVTKYLADTPEFAKESPFLKDILDTPISPELLPPSDDVMSQKTEKILGSYDLHDYVMYHLLTGKSCKDIYAGAVSVFSAEYEEEEIKRTVNTFFRRFITQQFKRNCLPDGVSVLGMSISPRGGLDMPSDMLGDVFGVI